jgi:CheY-like chemotaxis protein
MQLFAKTLNPSWIRAHYFNFRLTRHGDLGTINWLFRKDGMFPGFFKKFFAPAADRKHIKILVVDDVETNRTFFRRVLEKRGYTVLTAVDGPEGIKLVQKEHPQIVLLDFVMPGMKGPEVCKIIKAADATKEIPVLFLTSVDAPTDIIECYEQGAENFLTKPIQAGELIKHVEMILEDYKELPKKD